MLFSNNLTTSCDYEIAYIFGDRLLDTGETSLDQNEMMDVYNLELFSFNPPA